MTATTARVRKLLPSIRRLLRNAILCGLGGLFFVLPALAQAPVVSGPRHLTVETRAAIHSGLDWLVQQQQPSGAFGSSEDYPHNVGVSALCGLALLSSGSLPDSGPYAADVHECVDYLLQCAGPNGFIVETDVKTHGPMYGHGFATMFLAEVYGSSPSLDVHEPLKRAVDLILSSQNDQGGWRYLPTSDDADISVTVCQMMALRAARNAGIAVPKETIDRAVAYVRQCQNADGGFRYRLHDAAESKLPRSAAAIVALYTSGVHDDPAITRGLEFLERESLTVGDRTVEYFYYWQYYAAQASWHSGDDDWDAWFPRARDRLVQLQQQTGAWEDRFIGNEYATAMALIVLQLPNDYVPIFER